MKTLPPRIALIGLVLLTSFTPVARPAEPNLEYLFCFWNVENLFDDRADKYTVQADALFDNWFSADEKARQLKFDNIAKTLAKINDGKGPDVIALAEVESVRAVEMLRDNLNKRLGKEELQYKTLLMKDIPDAGRHIATAILSRVPAEADRTQLLGNKQRILETHLTVNGQALVVIASHWTARVTDEKGDARKRYADQIHGRYRAMQEKNPAVDFLVCGDFNDTPQDESVMKSLSATDDRKLVPKEKDVRLLNLFAGKDPAKFGTHNYNTKWFIFDQIVVSPGMLDAKGWTCDADSVKTINDLTADKEGRPMRFGNQRDMGERGFSDHFPVTVRLKVQGK